MIDIEHPMIRQIESTGYPSREYLDFEREEEHREEVREDEDDREGVCGLQR